MFTGDPAKAAAFKFLVCQFLIYTSLCQAVTAAHKVSKQAVSLRLQPQDAQL